jgi:hypothetical protein
MESARIDTSDGQTAQKFIKIEGFDDDDSNQNNFYGLDDTTIFRASQFVESSTRQSDDEGQIRQSIVTMPHGSENKPIKRKGYLSSVVSGIKSLNKYIKVLKPKKPN